MWHTKEIHEFKKHDIMENVLTNGGSNLAFFFEISVPDKIQNVSTMHKKEYNHAKRF